MERIHQQHKYVVSKLCLFFSLFVCALVLFCLLGCTQSSPETNQNNSLTTHPESYDAIYDAIEEIRARNESSGVVQNGEILLEDAATGTESISALSTDLSASASRADSFSQTNVQVEGIDEGDSVKNDGEFIYLISNSDVVIARADGGNTAEVSRIPMNTKTVDKSAESENKLYPSEIYIHDNTLLVVYSYSPEYFEELESDDSSYAGSFPSLYKTISEVACFDVSDRDNPRYLASFGQDGSLSSSRLQDGVLYLVTNHYISFSNEIARDKPETYIPLSYTADQTEVLPAPNIYLLPQGDTITYTVLSSIDVSELNRVDTASVLGANDTVYMSEQSLYLAGQTYEEVELNSYKDGSFTVTEYENKHSTNLVKFSLDKGTLSFVADTRVDGSLLNQFSLDEYKDHLRLVVTADGYQYRTLDDGTSTVYDYQTSEPGSTSNALYILDSALNQTGSIEGLGEDERIYSARFMGEIGYFVTFRNVDPLFAVDLSDSSNPSIKSALKIPGFSNYLHPYSENRLLGLGMAADSSGLTSGLKLSMFDTSNPYDVTEKHLTHLDDAYSEAQYNHKAALVDEAKNLICFPGSSNYHVYGYSDDEGFYLRKDLVQTSDSYYSSQRALYIDDYLYIVYAHGIDVYTLDSLDNAGNLSLPVDEPAYQPIRPLSTE